MKILFVSSGNGKTGISPIILNQGESLKEQKIELEYFTIKGKGVKGYFKSIFMLRKYLKNNSPDIIHSHYSLSAFVASLAGSKPLVVSLMGSDVKSKVWYKWMIKIFNYLFWQNVIVKSQDMYNDIKINNTYIIPNGINMDRFKPIPKKIALNKLGWDSSKKHILFTSSPKRVEKNFKLAKEAYNLLANKNLELHYLENIPNVDMPFYYNAADVVLLTSLWEGSPNAIKEAMACNRPIVSTDVGDVKQVLTETIGCYITEHNSEKISEKINLALNYSQTKGREQITHLDDILIAKKIIEIYKKIINKGNIK